MRSATHTPPAPHRPMGLRLGAIGRLRPHGRAWSGAFNVVMATAIVSIACHLAGVASISVVLLWWQCWPLHRSRQSTSGERGPFALEPAAHADRPGIT